MVRRGEVDLDFDVIKNWDNELDKINDGKEGALYRYPDSFVQLLGYICEHISIYHIDRLKV